MLRELRTNCTSRPRRSVTRSSFWRTSFSPNSSSGATAGLSSRRTFEACLGKISGALDLIDNALVQLKQPEERRERFTVGASASFTSLWLMPRIQSFVQSAPEIDMTLKTFLHRAAIESEQPDIQICNWETSTPPEDRALDGRGGHSGLLRGTLCNVWRNPPGALEELPLIHFERRVPAVNGQYPDWAHYLREFGVRREDITSGSKFNHNVAAIDAARAGLGVLLARSCPRRALPRAQRTRASRRGLPDPKPILSRHALDPRGATCVAPLQGMALWSGCNIEARPRPLMQTPCRKPVALRLFALIFPTFRPRARAPGRPA